MKLTLNDEGKTWDTKVYVKVSANGVVTMEDYEDRKGGFLDNIVDFFRSDYKK